MFKKIISHFCALPCDKWLRVNQRAAMFGLDARIALAIFGGLTIITGAALFAAIGQTRTTTILAEIDNIDKAITQYILDTSTDLPPQGAYRNIGELMSSSVAGWNGPYLNDDTGSVIGSGATIDRGDASFSTYFARDLDFDDDEWDGPDYPCVAGAGDCFYWIVYGQFNQAQVEALDTAIDGGDGGLTGRLRWEISMPSGIRWASFKGPARLVQ